MEEAILSWFNNVYMPLASVINKKHILHSFPKRTIADLYVWMVRYWDDLKKKFGDEVSLDDVASTFKQKYKIPITKRLINRIKCIILRKAIDNAATDSNDEI